MPQAQFIGLAQHMQTASAPTDPGAGLGLSLGLGLGLGLTATLFADRRDVRRLLRGDVEAAGITLVRESDLAELREGWGADGDCRAALGDVALVDCRRIAGAELAALAQLDAGAARTGAQLIVQTSLAALDDVFGCLDRANAQILVDPTSADRVVALGRALAHMPSHRLRELNEVDRLTLLRLAEQVERIAQKLDRLTGAPAAHGRIDGEAHNRALEAGADRCEASRQAFAAARGESAALRRADRPTVAKPGLPDPRLVRRIIRQRQMRARFFDPDLFADPAWDILLDLAAAQGERRQVSVSSLCLAAGTPPTTALRWIGQMTQAGLLRRDSDRDDRRRAFISLTERAADAVARYFAALGPAAMRLA